MIHQCHVEEGQTSFSLSTEKTNSWEWGKVPHQDEKDFFQELALKESECMKKADYPDVTHTAGLCLWFPLLSRCTVKNSNPNPYSTSLEITQ